MGNNRLTINLISNIISYSSTILISFVLTPYLINTLGKEAYSFYPLANNFVNFMGILTLALNSMANLPKHLHQTLLASLLHQHHWPQSKVHSVCCIIREALYLYTLSVTVLSPAVRASSDKCRVTCHQKLIFSPIFTC